MIFETKKKDKVTKLEAEFADGSKLIFPPANFAVLFLELFNILFDENVDLKLSTANLVDARINNWNKINAVICFNYF